ncbi:NADPH-dependent FMN reductase [Plantibacter sp. YIM 135347]|uniref:NADPH-dependent FMN reductase n=1 Tax=Plantibacter sp. YIM 135347 TaxID=3423919 RepID=UPI003D355639
MPPLTLPVISCSLDPSSASRRLAERSARYLTEAGHAAPLIDLVDHPLPAFDNDAVFTSSAFTRLHEVISRSDGVVLAFPIYNWAPASSVKNLIEATGTTGDGVRTAAWFDKVVTFVCAAGLPHSYMATGQLANSLMLDFTCIVNPYTAYVSERDWTAEGDLVESRTNRLAKTLTVHAELSGALLDRSYRSEWEV